MDLITKRFPVIISVCCVVAFIYPESFTWFKPFISWGLMIIMLGMGLTLKTQDFLDVLKFPKWILIGVLFQFTLMPLLGFSIAKLFQLNDLNTFGLVLVACCPGGTASNLIAYLAKANVSLSITMTAVSTVLAAILTPSLTLLYAGNTVEINPTNLFIDTAFVVLIPITIGVILNLFLSKFTTRISKVTPSIAIISIVLIVAAIIGANKENILKTGISVAGAVFLMHFLGFFIAFYVSKALLKRLDVAKTISIEVGMQNSGLGAVLANKSFPNTSASLPSAISALTHCLLGSFLAWKWGATSNKDAKLQ